MGVRSRRQREARQLDKCQHKIHYSTWDAAEKACLAIWREAPVHDANPPCPYPCDLNGKPHYHVGHLRFS
jgi:hypothetical protein